MPSHDGEYVRRWLPPEFAQQESSAAPNPARLDALALFGALLLIAMVLVLVLTY